MTSGPWVQARLWDWMLKSRTPSKMSILVLKFSRSPYLDNREVEKNKLVTCTCTCSFIYPYTIVLSVKSFEKNERVRVDFIKYINKLNCVALPQTSESTYLHTYMVTCTSIRLWSDILLLHVQNDLATLHRTSFLLVPTYLTYRWKHIKKTYNSQIYFIHSLTDFQRVASILNL